MTEYDKKFMLQLMESFKKHGLICNSSKRLCADDHGFFLYVLSVRPCPIGGVYIETGVRFCWFNPDGSILFKFYFGNKFGDNRVRVDKYMLWTQDSFDTQKILETPGAYEYVEKCLFKNIDMYRELKNLKKFRKALIQRKDFHYLQFGKNSKKRDVDLAIINYLLGNFDESRESLEYITSIVGEREHFNKIINLCREKNIDYDYINNEIMENRLSLQKHFKKLPVNPNGYFN